MTLYNTQAEIERYLSTAGVVAFADHDEDGAEEATVVSDCIYQAKGDIDLYCRGRYTEAGLASSDIVKRWSIVLSSYYLCERRGNEAPASLAREAARILETLLPQVQSGVLNIPGLAFGNDLRPAFSNLTVDRRYARDKIRVTPTNSSNQTSQVERHVDPEVVHHV